MPGFDEVLGGGLVATGLYLVEGAPGAGKTILATQVAFSLVGRGKRVLFVSLVAESHGKLLSHLRGFEFFDNAAVATQIVFASAAGALLRGGLTTLAEAIVEQMHEVRPALMIIDGFGAARQFSQGERPSSDGDRDFARFIHNLNALVSMTNCTVLLLAPSAGTGGRPEHSLVDGLIELGFVSRGLRRARYVEVHKLRGGRHLTGRHFFAIDDAGVSVFPRLEAVVEHMAAEAPEDRASAMIGVAGLDAMAKGGIRVGSSTCLLGPPGVGKTLLGLSFLHQGLSRGETALYLGFNEAPERLIAKAAAAGLDLREHLAAGRLIMQWHAPVELLLDQVTTGLLAAAGRHRVARVFVDGVEGLLEASMLPDRMPQYLAALTVRLRAARHTSVFSYELPIYQDVIDSVGEVSALFENVILMRYFEHDGELRRLLGIVKMRESAYDASLREFTIAASGVRVGEKLDGLGGLLTGRPTARPMARGPRPRHGHQDD